MKPGGSLGLAPGARSTGSEFPSECLVCPGPTTARNRLFGGGHRQVIGQRLPLGEADDAGDLAACSPAHRTLQLCQAALLPFACCCRDGSGEGRETRDPGLPTPRLPRGLTHSSRCGQARSPHSGLQSGQDLLCTVCVWQAPAPPGPGILPDPPQAPTMFAGLSAAKGGTVIAHAQAVGV